MTSETCECGHTLDEHEFDDERCLGCIYCSCDEYIEEVKE